MDNEVLYYKRMKKYCKTQVELAIRMHLHFPDDKLLPSKLHISPKRIEEFLCNATPEDTTRVYNDLMCVEDRTDEEEYYCKLHSALWILARVKAAQFQYQELLLDGYSVDEAAEEVERTPEKMMEYNGMTPEDLVRYAERRVAMYCDSKTHRLQTHFLDMEF